MTEVSTRNTQREPFAFEDTALELSNDPIQTFTQLRDIMDGIKEDFMVPWSWLPFNNVEEVQEHLLKFAGRLHKSISFIDQSYYHLVCFPNRYKECVAAMTDVGEDGDIIATDLSSMCEGLQHKLKGLRQVIKEHDAQMQKLKEEFAEELNIKDEEIDTLKTALAKAIEEAKEFEERMIRSVNELRDSKEETENLRRQIQALDFRILKVEAQNVNLKTKILSFGDVIIGMQDLDTTRGIFLHMRRILGIDRLNRMMSKSNNSMLAEVAKSRDLVEKLNADMIVAKGAAEILQRKNDNLIESRFKCATRILEKFNPEAVGRLRLCFPEWKKIIPILRLENALEKSETKRLELGEEIKEMSIKIAFLVKDKEFVEEEFKRYVVESRRQSVNARISYFCRIIKIRAHNMVKIKKIITEAKQRLFEECEKREEHILMMERAMRENAEGKALEERCRELEWELEQSLTGRPSKVVRTDPRRLCAACCRQVVYQDYLEMRENVSWKVPLMTPSTSESICRTLSVKDIKFNKVWQP